MNGGKSLISGIKFSSVVPANVSGEDKVQELKAMDLVMKLHYIKGVYFFKASEEIRKLTIYDLKKPMFNLLKLYYVTSGRIRRESGDGGRPFIKCNDSGVRIVEADCEESIDEWLSMEDCDKSHRDSDLVFSQAIGPDLGFSPLVFIQLTRFKCGGLTVGLSWAHILGDFFSASTFINLWGQLINNDQPMEPLHVATPSLHSINGDPSSVKRVNPVGDLWIASNDCKMATHSFLITEQHLDRILAVVGRNQVAKFSHFEAITAIFWKSLFKIKEDSISNSNSDTIAIYSTKCPNRDGVIPSNGMVSSTIEADISIAEAEEGALALMIKEKMMEENGGIEELVEGEMEESDFVAYGARLTFVNLEEMNIYGLELRGQKPIYANNEVGGVGDEGMVLVLPGPPDEGGRYGGDRMATAILPEKQLSDLKDELKKQWLMV